MKFSEVLERAADVALVAALLRLKVTIYATIWKFPYAKPLKV
jgi:hypothetical protein